MRFMFFDSPCKSLAFLRSSSNSSEDDDGASTTQVTEDIGSVVKLTANSLMEAGLDALSRELAKLRTGRASIGMLDHIVVGTGGVKMNLNRISLVTIIDSKTWSITPYDPEKEVNSRAPGARTRVWCHGERPRLLPC
ncbi:uncharacterized protein [Spinacia oleracea]|uniref:Ribosome-recycling factor, chloroplastic n=1 Tax=Spinacia oleracea TaxID=3562 RepID=A0A9R0J923_SPIOL|nr:uncharacterized protein LOC110802063 [Spinacia oleracea]